MDTTTLTDSVDNRYSFEFSEKSIRLGFIRKVYSILLCQLLVTIAAICIFLYVDAVREFSEANVWLYIVAIVGSFILIIVLACCPDVRRSHPINIILLGLFTLFESFLLGSISSHYEKWEVLMAVGVTAVVVFGLTVFAMQTKIDFTMCSAGLFCGCHHSHDLWHHVRNHTELLCQHGVCLYWSTHFCNVHHL